MAPESWSAPPAAPPPLSRGDWAYLGAFGAGKVLLHLPFLTRYGFHHDELYFLACGRHLAFGYVDHAPLVPWVARLADELLPGSLVALRLPAVLGTGAAVLLTGLLARQLGGGRFAQAVACLSAIVATVFLRVATILHLPAFEIPLWALATWLVVRIVQEDRPRLWPWVGLVAGVGLLAKHSMLLFGFGLAAGLLLTPQRRQLRSPWLWAGLAVSLLLLVPNLLWQVQHGWLTLEHYRQLNRGQMSGIAFGQFAAGQVLYLHPVTFPIWLGGLLFLFSKRGEPYRLLGWMYLSLFVLLAVLKSKIYYLAPAYPALLAAGAVAWEGLAQGRAWLRPATLGALGAAGALFVPIGIPMLSIDATERFVTRLTFGAFQNVYELTGDFRGMFAWPERVRLVADVFARLPAEERARAVVYAPWYGMAGAIDQFGPALGLPRAVSSHMTYHLWGLPDGPIDVVVAAGARPEGLRELFEEVAVEADVELPDVNAWERRFVVSVCRRPRVDLRREWGDRPRW